MNKKLLCAAISAVLCAPVSVQGERKASPMRKGLFEAESHTKRRRQIMKRSLLCAAVAATLAAPAAATAADSADVAEVKRMIEQMKVEYEQKIEALEQRLEAAEQKAGTAKQASAASTAERERSGMGALTSGTAFNPQISVILDGNYYQDGIDGEGTDITANAFQPSHTHGNEEEGHDHGGHAHGSTEQGFNFREAEIVFSATVDPYFDAMAMLAITGDGDVDLEEAWFQTRSLPQGFKLKGGKFLSDFGYINRQHPHQWDFTDQTLVYENLLGDHGLQDTGVQLTWLPDLPVYTLFGAELLQGDQERFGAFVDDEEREETGLGDRKDGPRLWTVFAKVAPELGYDHALQLGASYAHNRQHQEIHEHDGFENSLAGDADLWGLDLVYKYDGKRAYGHRDFKLQSEYLRSIKDLKVQGGDPDAIGSTREFTTDGIYAQALYGIFPRWQLGLRYDVFGLTNEVSGGENESFGSSDRWAAALTWTPTEFSRFRLQYAYNDILTEPRNRETFSTVWLQYLMSLGTHGAHAF